MRPKRLFSHLHFAVFAFCASIGVIAHPRVASAQSESRQSRHADRDQHVAFDDDLLSAKLITPFGDPVLSSHVRPARVTLIRPRTTFVPELYESVERI